MPLWESILAWCEDRPTLHELLGLILKGLIFLVLWVVGASYMLALVQREHQDHEVLRPQPECDNFVNLLTYHPLEMLGTMLYIVFNEELRFRLVPLSIALAIAKMWDPLRFLIPIALVLSSLAFGLIHVGNYAYISADVILSTIILQGVMGFVFGLVFLKYTGLHLRYVAGALVASTAIHLAWNILVSVPQMLRAHLY